MSLSQVYSDQDDDPKKQAAEYLSAQIYQLYEERRALVSQNDDLVNSNAELQRLACAQRIELDKFTAYVR